MAGIVPEASPLDGFPRGPDDRPQTIPEPGPRDPEEHAP